MTNASGRDEKHPARDGPSGVGVEYEFSGSPVYFPPAEIALMLFLLQMNSTLFATIGVV